MIMRGSKEEGALIVRESIDREQLNDRFGPFLDDVTRKLRDSGIVGERCIAARDIVHEYLLNVAFHHVVGTEELPVIEIRKQGDSVMVTMHGKGAAKDISRMQDIVRDLAEKGTKELWSELNRRSAADKPFETRGAGLGLLMVAALSEGGALSMKSQPGGQGFSLSSYV